MADKYHTSNSCKKQKTLVGMNRPEKLYLLLMAKSLSQNRRDKRYLLKIISLDHDRKCHIENSFEHGYEYVYKLWPCLPSQREFVRIEMLQKVGEQMVKRGQAAPLVRYSQEGQRFQFTGSHSEQCVLILKFRVSTLGEVEKHLSSLQLQRLNNQVELELIKNKHQNENYHSYLEYTNRFLDFLDNSKYLDTPDNQAHEDTLKTIKSTQPVPEQPTDSTISKPFKPDPNFMSDFNSRMRESLEKLSNGRYFAQSPSPTNKNGLTEIEEQQTANQIELGNGLAREESYQISSQIKKRRNKYTEIKPQIIENKQYQALNTPSITEDQSSMVPSSEQQRLENTPKQSQPPIIRTNDFPLKEESIQLETSRRNARRRKKPHSENKQIKDSYGSAIKRIEDVDLTKIFDQRRIRDKPQQTKVVTLREAKQLRVQLYGLSLQLFRGDLDLPKKLIVEVGKMKYHTLPANMKNKQAQWGKRLIIGKCSASATLHCKVFSVSEFSFFNEGQAKLRVSDLIRSDNNIIQLYINANNVVVGSIEFQYKITPYDETQEYANDETFIRHNRRVEVRNQRKSLSLPQISHPTKAMQRGKQLERLGTISSHAKVRNRTIQQNNRYSASPNYEQPHQQLSSNFQDRPSVLSRAKEKKIKLRAKMK